jgi:hypothetical protein
MSNHHHKEDHHHHEDHHHKEHAHHHDHEHDHHHHDHGDDHHNHDHDHDHKHHPESKKASDSLSLEEKLVKLLDHWVSHNDDHAKNYRDWGAQAQAKGLTEVTRSLEDASQLTEKISELFKTAKNSIK